MPPIAHPVIQLDGSKYAGSNCVPTSDAMLIDRSTRGRVRTSGAHVRLLTGDTVGGCNLDEMRAVNLVAYGLKTRQVNAFPWDNLVAESADQGFILLINYDTIRGTQWDCFKGNFSANHGIWVNHWDAVKHRWIAADPGADGRPDGHGYVPLGYQEYPDSILKVAASRLLISATTSARLGLGKAQVLFSVPDSAPPPPVVTPPTNGPIVVPNGPAPKEPNIMIGPAYNVSAVRRMLLKQGQPCFRAPGGKKVTAMSGTKAVPYLGPAGPGWAAVLIGTGSPYADKKTRPTILYVPSAAGPVSAS